MNDEVFKVYLLITDSGDGTAGIHFTSCQINDLDELMEENPEYWSLNDTIYSLNFASKEEAERVVGNKLRNYI